MASIERTAYPRFRGVISDRELQKLYQLSLEELDFIKTTAKGVAPRLTLATLLKTRQQAGYFPSLRDVPDQIIEFLASQMGISQSTSLIDEREQKTTIHNHRSAIRVFLASNPYSNGGEKCASDAISKAARTMSDPADLINVAIEQLIKTHIELPAFSTMDRLAGHLRQKVHEEIYAETTAGLHDDQGIILDNLLELPAGEQVTGFTRLKQSPGTPTITRIREWSDRLSWMCDLLDPKPFLQGIAHTKIRQFAAEAAANEISDMRNIRNEARRRTLLLCLLHEAQTRTRDDLIEMFLRRMKKTENAAKNKLTTIQKEYRSLEETLISALAEILRHAKDDETNDESFGRNVRTSLAQCGGIDSLQSQYEAVSAYHQNNYLPLMWDIHAKNRSALFRILGLLKICSANQDEELIKALELITEHRYARGDFLPLDINIGFASERWQSLVVTRKEKTRVLDRRGLEICVLWHVAEELRSGNLYVEGSQDYSDPRAQLLPWNECEELLPAYCKGLGMPQSPANIVAALRAELEEAARSVDTGFADNTELAIDSDGRPHLKRQAKAPKPENLKAFQDEVRARMPERHLLDILNNTNHWAEYTRHFGPPSGSDPKLSNPTLRYLFTLFGYGCFLGPSQTERHAQSMINRQTLRRINAQHISGENLEAALRDLIQEYTRFQLPEFWGKGRAAIADGTHIELVENNLLGEQHIRYGGYGGIAYHHISDNYVALFCNFIACGVWEAVYILDGLLQNRSDIQPDTLHADTHGQSEPVFALAHLLGIQLFPRMRNWNNVTFYRSTKNVKYKHINALFTDVVDWNYIERHMQDLLQVVLSIQAGKVLPSMLLRKLGSRSKKNKLYRAFRELGRVKRTIFLLRYISDPDFRFGIRAETTKIESFHDFMDWIAFGGTVIKSGDPVEQSKRMKYLDVVANAIMLQNVVDLTEALIDMSKDGHTITPDLVASLSPYMREHILRFGRLTVDIENKPEPLLPKSVPIAA
ncbi:MAG: Tn3 family transposase [Pseudomonadota bacterium]